jgi:hypothetical protein
VSKNDVEFRDVNKPLIMALFGIELFGRKATEKAIEFSKESSKKVADILKNKPTKGKSNSMPDNVKQDKAGRYRYTSGNDKGYIAIWEK